MPLPALFDKQRLPVLAAPMFLVSERDLVIEACGAGVSAAFPALNKRSSEDFEAWLVEVKAALEAQRLAAPDAPRGTYGVNLIVHRSNPRMQRDLEICVAQQVPLVITSLGAVREVVEAVHSYGGIVFHDVTNLRHAQKAIEAGVDGLVLVAGGAGGHAGTTNPFALVAEIRAHFEGCIILAGCLSTGRDVLAAQAMGADLAYMGTRFIATRESNAQQGYKEMLLEARPGDIIHTPAVSGVPANFMRQSLEQNGFDLAKLMNPGEVDFGNKLTVSDEAKAWKTIWSAGHGVASIHDVPTVRELVDRLEAEYRAAREALAL